MIDAGFGGDSPRDLLLCMIFLNVMNTIGNFIGLALSGKHGRRELMLKSTIPMGIALCLLTGCMVVNMAIGGAT